MRGIDTFATWTVLRRPRWRIVVQRALLVSGALGVSLTTWLARPPSALAGCVGAHTMVQGADLKDPRWGNGAYLYINDQSSLSDLHGGDGRSLKVLVSPLWDVEVGWVDDDGTHVPTVFSEQLRDGTLYKPWLDTKYKLGYNSYITFKVQNTTHQGFWRFYVGSQTTPFNISKQFPHNSGDSQTGVDLTNSEHYSSCDSLWTEFHGLEYFNSAARWVGGYGNLEPWCDSTEGRWLFFKHPNDNRDQWVDQDNGTSKSLYTCV